MPVSDQGIELDRYVIMPRTLIFITRGEYVLLLQGGPHKHLWSGLYNGIGGHVERGEDILSAAYRELGEESSIEVVDLWLCGLITIDTGEDIGVGIYVLRGDIPTIGSEITEQLPPSSEGTLEWVPINQISNFPLVEDLHTLLPRVIGTKRSDPPFFAHYWYDEADRLVITFRD